MILCSTVPFYNNLVFKRGEQQGNHSQFAVFHDQLTYLYDYAIIFLTETGLIAVLEKLFPPQTAFLGMGKNFGAAVETARSTVSTMTTRSNNVDKRTEEKDLINPTNRR